MALPGSLDLGAQLNRSASGRAPAQPLAHSKRFANENTAGSAVALAFGVRSRSEAELPLSGARPCSFDLDASVGPQRFGDSASSAAGALQTLRE